MEELTVTLQIGYNGPIGEVVNVTEDTYINLGFWPAFEWVEETKKNRTDSKGIVKGSSTRT